jgi:hypothetical protein
MGGSTASQAPKSAAPLSPPPVQDRRDGFSHLHPALMGLLKLIPPADEPWTQDRRDRVLRAWEATMDVCNPVEVTTSDSQR